MDYQIKQNNIEMIRQKSLSEIRKQQAILRFETAIRLLDKEISPQQAKARIYRIYQAYSNSLQQQFVKQ